MSYSGYTYKDMKPNENIHVQVYNTVMYTRDRAILFRAHVYLIPRDCVGIQ